MVSVKDVLREYVDMKEEIKNWKLQQFIKDFNLFIKQCYLTIWSVEKIQKVKTQKLKRQIKEECAVCDREEACRLLDIIGYGINKLFG